MMIDVFDGMVNGEATFRREHPFLVFGPRPKSDLNLTEYRKVGKRMRHMPVRHTMRTVREVSRKTGLPRVVRESSTIRRASPNVSRQVRRALERANAKFARQEG